MPHYSRFAFSVALLFSLAGCQEKPVIRQYSVAPETKKIVTTEAVRSQFPVIPFHWTVPPDWRMAPNDQFSVVAWAAGPKDPKSEARITLSDLPASAGLEAQVVRWRGQISLPAVDPSEAMKDAEALKIGSETGTLVELKGPEETILGLIVSRPDKMWIVKYKSARATADQQRKSFREFCESFRLETTVGG